jgi:hypothetical protein
MGRGTSLAGGLNEYRAGASMAAGGSGPGMGAQEAQKEARQGQNRAQRAILLERAREAAAKLAELVGELVETGASTPPEEAGLEERLKTAAAVLQMTGPESQPTNVSGKWSDHWSLVCCGQKDREQSRDGNARCQLARKATIR